MYLKTADVAGLKVFYREAGDPQQSATVGRDVFLHQTGARLPEALDPGHWAMDAYAFSIPASRDFMTRLLMNIEGNFPHSDGPK